MKRTLLVNEIVDFCFEHGIFNKSEESKNVKVSIYHQLEDVIFVEQFINLLIIKTKNRHDIDFEKLKMLLLELEKIRLELEYK